MPTYVQTPTRDPYGFLPQDTRNVVGNLLRWIGGGDPGQQAQQMVSPLGFGALPGLLSPEAKSLASRLNVPAKEIQDWITHARPGVYKGWRASRPMDYGGEIRKTDLGQGSWSATDPFVQGGTFYTKDPLYAEGYRQGKWTGGVPSSRADENILHEVEGVFRQPLNLNIPEHQNVLGRLITQDAAHTGGIGGWYTPSVNFKKYYEGIVGGNSWSNVKGLRQEPFVMRLRPTVVDSLRRLGYDAIVMPEELEGKYPTIVGFGGKDRMVMRPAKFEPTLEAIPGTTPEAMLAHKLRGVGKHTHDQWAALPPERKKQVLAHLMANPLDELWKAIGVTQSLPK